MNLSEVFLVGKEAVYEGSFTVWGRGAVALNIQLRLKIVSPVAPNTRFEQAVSGPVLKLNAVSTEPVKSSRMAQRFTNCLSEGRGEPIYSKCGQLVRKVTGNPAEEGAGRGLIQPGEMLCARYMLKSRRVDSPLVGYLGIRAGVQ